MKFKHTQKELEEIHSKIRKVELLDNLLREIRDEFLILYVNLLSSEIQAEIDKYNYLIGRKLLINYIDFNNSIKEFTITKILGFNKNGIEILSDNGVGFRYTSYNFESKLIPLE